MTDKQPEQHPEMAPDPDEDDLSDLDDMLDDFSTASIKDKPPAASTSAPAQAPSTNPAPQSSSTEDDEFANQLQAGMAELLGQFGTDPDMQKQFEEMMKELSAAAQQEAASEPVPSQSAPEPATTQPATPKTASASSSTAKPAFASTIEKTMERMQASGQSASAAAANSSEDDFLAQMLKDLESGNFPAMDGDQGDFNSMLMGMMEQLVNKDILYEPMKELDQNFPEWLEKNRDSTSKEDMERYKTQQSVVKDIVQRFEKKDFSDENKEDREYIVDKMQQVFLIAIFCKSNRY